MHSRLSATVSRIIKKLSSVYPSYFLRLHKIFHSLSAVSVKAMQILNNHFSPFLAQVYFFFGWVIDRWLKEIFSPLSLICFFNKIISIPSF